MRTIFCILVLAFIAVEAASKKQDLHVHGVKIAEIKQTDWPQWAPGECVDYEEIHYAKNCKEILNQGYKTSGLYHIFKADGTTLEVFCEMNIAEGGWTQLLHVTQKVVDTTAEYAIDDHQIVYDNVMFIACKNHRFSYNKDLWPHWSSKGYNTVLNYLKFDGKPYMVKAPKDEFTTPADTQYISVSSFKRMGPVPTVCYFENVNTPGNCFYQFILPKQGVLQGFGDRRSASTVDTMLNRFDYDFTIYVR